MRIPLAKFPPSLPESGEEINNKIFQDEINIFSYKTGGVNGCLELEFENK